MKWENNFEILNIDFEDFEKPKKDKKLDKLL